MRLVLDSFFCEDKKTRAGVRGWRLKRKLVMVKLRERNRGKRRHISQKTRCEMGTICWPHNLQTTEGQDPGSFAHCVWEEWEIKPCPWPRVREQTARQLPFRQTAVDTQLWSHYLNPPIGDNTSFSFDLQLDFRVIRSVYKWSVISSGILETALLTSKQLAQYCSKPTTGPNPS